MKIKIEGKCSIKTTTNHKEVTIYDVKENWTREEFHSEKDVFNPNTTLGLSGKTIIDIPDGDDVNWKIYCNDGFTISEYFESIEIGKGNEKYHTYSNVINKNDKKSIIKIKIKTVKKPHDSVLVCPCMYEEEGEDEGFIYIKLIARFKNKICEEEDCDGYFGILKELNQALCEGKGEFYDEDDEKKYNKKNLTWFVASNEVEIEEDWEVNYNIIPDIDLTKK